MNSNLERTGVLAAAVAALLTSGVAAGQGEDPARNRDRDATQDRMQQERMQQERMQERSGTRTAGNEMQRTAMDSQEQVNEARKVVMKMKQDPQLTNLLERAQGVFIVPAFGKAAAGVGGRGGEGVLLVKRDREWSGPAFYNFGRVSAGLQAGASAGSIAMLLMSQDAVRPFTTEGNTFSLDAAAGLTIVNYSAAARDMPGEPDVVMWSDTKGLFAGASIGVTGFVRDEDDNRAYYDRQATPQQIFSGSVKNPHADALKQSLPTRTASR